MDWSRISPHLVWLLVVCLFSFSVVSSLHSSWAGEPSRPPPASAGHCCPTGPGGRASPAPDMGHARSPRRPRGVHRPRLLRCWVQETACLSASPQPCRQLRVLPPTAGRQRGSGRGPITSGQSDQVQRSPRVAATVAAARSDSVHSVPSLRAVPLREIGRAHV